jgi:hypothetical protein
MQRFRLFIPVVALVALLLGAWVFKPDTFAQAKAQTRVGLNRALATFATARAPRAALSVLLLFLWALQRALKALAGPAAGGGGTAA